MDQDVQAGSSAAGPELSGAGGSGMAVMPFAEHRLSLTLRSGLAVLFAVAFFWPTVSGIWLARLFAAYAFTDGALALAPAGWRLARCRAWPLLIGGVIDLAAAGFIYFWPGMTVPLLIPAAAIWAVATGAMMTLACVTLREIDDGCLFLLGGIAALVFGRALLSHSEIGVVVLSTWMGLYTLTIGIVLFKLVLPHYRPLLD